MRHYLKLKKIDLRQIRSETSNLTLLFNKICLTRSLTRKMLQERNVFYDAYVRTYLQRDIKDILNITDANRFLQFLRMIAARTG